MEEVKGSESVTAHFGPEVCLLGKLQYTMSLKNGKMSKGTRNVHTKQ